MKRAQFLSRTKQSIESAKTDVVTGDEHFKTLENVIFIK